MDGFYEKAMPTARCGKGNLVDSNVSSWVRKMGVGDELAAVPGLTNQHMVALVEHGVKTLDNLANLASDELLEIVGEYNMTCRQADAVIMAARAHWFQD